MHKKINKLEGSQVSESDLHNARLENAFLRHLMTKDQPLSNVEDAWDLATTKGYFDGCKVNEDGSVAGMDAALEKLVARYPWLAGRSEDGEEEPVNKPTGGRAVRPLTRGSTAASSRASLEKRFPALKGRRGHW